MCEVNFLGHFVTSSSDDMLMAGSYLGDFMKGIVTDHPGRFQKGLRLHRRVDRLVDSHPSFRAIVHTLRPISGRYAPVVADIVNDHLLASGWSRWFEIELEDFVSRCHRVVEKNLDTFPELPKRVARRLVAEEWLLAYRTPAGLRRSLERLESRIGVDVGSSEVEDLLLEWGGEMSDRFSSLLDFLESELESVALKRSMN